VTRVWVFSGVLLYSSEQCADQCTSEGGQLQHGGRAVGRTSRAQRFRQGQSVFALNCTRSRIEMFYRFVFYDDRRMPRGRDGTGRDVDRQHALLRHCRIAIDFAVLL